MPHPKILKLGDPCPACGGEIRPAPQATDAERAKAVSTREDYVPLPTHYDTAPVDVIAELGPLHRCRDCGFTHRFGSPPEVKASGTLER